MTSPSAPGDEPTGFVPAKDSKPLEIVIAACSLALGIVVYVLSQNIALRAASTDSVGPRWWPEHLAMAIVALSALLLIVAIARPPLDRSDLEAATRTGWTKMSSTVLATAVYFFAWPTFGFLPATAVFVALLVFIFGGRTWKALLAFPLGTTLFLYLLFHYLLRVPL